MTSDDASTHAASRRAQNTDAAILEATLDILRTRGPAAVNMESVAAASGVAKSTLYRRYENRDELLAAAVRAVTVLPAIPPELTAEEELRWVVRRCRDGVEHVLGLGGVSGVLVDQDHQFSVTIRAMLVPWIALVRSILVEGARSGRFRTDIDVDVALNFILGSSLGEFLRVGEVSDAWTDRVLLMLWPTLLPPGTAIPSDGHADGGRADGGTVTPRE